MPQLSPEGTRLVEDVSRRYGLSTDAVTHMLIATHNGNGSMAQFNHPEFGGSGQWMRGGMTMVSDIFNHQLKSLVDNVCNELSNALANHQSAPFSGSFQSQSQSGSGAQAQGAGHVGIRNSLFVPDPKQEWWPSHLGTPSAVGAQNNIRYAYFAGKGRLAVTTGGPAWVYDTRDHQIGGFGQQQGGGSSITFTSQYGTVDLASLSVVWSDGGPVQEQPTQPTRAPAPQEPAQQSPPLPAAPPAAQTATETATHAADAALGPASVAPTDTGQDPFALLERLGALKDKGYITEDEFQAKKTEILNRI